MTTGEKIKVLRTRLGLTQTELGEKLGVKKNAVSKWECGRVDDIPGSKIRAMCTLFDVPPSYLIDEDIETTESMISAALADEDGVTVEIIRRALQLSDSDKGKVLSYILFLESGAENP